jgi:N-dimethylarginine dimethylaminohydrolase
MINFLMCWNNSYQVNYDINPWMHNQQHNVDTEKAYNEFITLRSKLENSGAEIYYFNIYDNVIPDIVFTANYGIVKNKKCLLSNFFFEERTREIPHIKKMINDVGYSIYEIPENIKFEGAGDCLLDPFRPIAWLGFGFRSSINAKKYVEEFYGDEITVRQLRLIKDNFYHLDTCFCPLQSGHVVYYDKAFDDYSNYIIDLIFGDKAICVNDEDAYNFVCNAVEVNNNIIVNSGCSKYFKQKMSDIGYNIVETSLSEFMKAGGSAKCLTLRLD